ncbi:hypothetical protein AOQ84DRAFT_200878 [Glonium stellatum]|uniref:Uncharacterized protein n=1 Tax=Glonium stellatum TaxID=574774 RepID=A0A8E2F6C9_9PEZI|nr:hypothetical protein AOQ84DRAFT_200878 [Glonium stellatum]
MHRMDSLWTVRYHATLCIRSASGSTPRRWHGVREKATMQGSRFRPEQRTKLGPPAFFNFLTMCFDVLCTSAASCFQILYVLSVWSTKAEIYY